MILTVRQWQHFPMQGLADPTHEPAAPRQSPLVALLRLVPRLSLRVGVDDDAGLSPLDNSPAKCTASVVLPTPPFWLSRATFMPHAPVTVRGDGLHASLMRIVGAGVHRSGGTYHRYAFIVRQVTECANARPYCVFCELLRLIARVACAR